MIFYAVLPDYRIASFFPPDKAVVDMFGNEPDHNRGSTDHYQSSRFLPQ